MNSRNKLIYAAAGFIAALGIVMLIVGQMREAAHTGAQNTHEQQEEAPVAAGNKAANFKLESLDGTTVSLDQLRGKVVFLNVWATWCGPCREEMPSMETLYDEFSHDPNFVVLAVSEDSEGRNAVDSYVQGNALRFNVLLDPQSLVGDAYDVSG